MIVLDTNVVSELFRPRPEAAVVDWVRNLTGTVAITAVTAAELLAGVRRLDDGKRKVALAQGIAAVLERYEADGAVLPFDSTAAAHYADIVASRSRAGRPIATADAQIAAICRLHAATCATRNTGDFLGTGIDLVDPWDDCTEGSMSTQ